MIITEYQIDRYRDGHPLKVLDLGNGLNVALVSDAIERGAMFHLLPYVLYGSDAARRPNGKVAHVLAAGTNLVARTDNGVFRIDRRQDARLPLSHDVTIQSPDGSVHDPAYLETLVDGIDPRTYDRVFTLGGRQLERDVRRSRGRMLTEMGKIAKYLKHRSRQTDGPGKPSKMALPGTPKGLDRHVVDLTSLIRKQLDLDAQAPGKIAANGNLPSKTRTKNELQKIDAALIEFQQKEKIIDRDLQDTQLAIRLSQLQMRLAEVQHHLSKVGEASGASNKKAPSVRGELQDIESKIRRCKQQLEEIADQRREALLAKQGDERFTQVKELLPRIEAVLLQEKFLVNEEQSIEQLASSIRDLESRAEAERHQAESRASDLSLQSSRAMHYLTEIDRFAAQLADAKTQFRQARRRYSNAKSATRVPTSSADDDAAEFDAAAVETDPQQIQETESLVRRLRERFHLDEELSGLSAERADLLAKVQRLYQSHLPPWRILMALGVPFMIGAGMTVAGLFGYPDTRWDLVGWGMLIALASALFKLSLDHRASDQLAASRRRLREITRHLHECERRKTELDGSLPNDPNSIKSQLRIAQRRLADLRSRSSGEVPTSTTRRRRTTTRRSSAEVDRLRRHASEARSRYRDIGSRWKTLLLDLGLPQTMSPSEARFAIEQRANEPQSISSLPDSALDFQLRQLRHDLERRRNGLNEMLSHSRELVHELGFSSSGAAIGEQMDILRESIQEYKEELENRREYDHTLKELKDQDSRLRKTGRDLSQQRRALIDATRGKEEEEKSRQRIFAEKTKLLETEREELVRQIEEMSFQEGNEVHAAALAELTLAELEARQSELRDQHSVARIEVVKLVELKGRCHERLRLVDDIPKMKKSKARWNDVLAKSLELADLFDTANEPHESRSDELVDNAPARSSSNYQYLDRASQYLRALADPRMTQIQLDDDDPGTEIRIEVRSGRGNWISASKLRPKQLTMLYTCLWMAQLEAFQDQGIHLPIVIDDPLSLVGQQRAQRLAEQLTEFAACGHQVLLVTSSPKHAQLFVDLDVPIADFSQPHQAVAALPKPDEWTVPDISGEPSSSRDNGFTPRPEHRYA